jgi:hypothetical protein
LFLRSFEMSRNPLFEAIQTLITTRNQIGLARTARFHVICAENPITEDWSSIDAADAAVASDPILRAYDNAIAGVQAELDALTAFLR